MTHALRRTRGRPRAANGLETRDRIICAARYVFSELGYDAATFQAIADRADLTRPAINHYFTNKRALYDEVLQTTNAALFNAGVANAGNETTLLGRITAFMTGITQAHHENPSAAAFLVTSMIEAYRHPELSRDDYGPRADFRSFIAGAVSAAVTEGQLADHTNQDVLVDTVLVLMFGMGFYAGFVGSEDQVAAVVDKIQRLLSSELWQLRV